VGASLVWFIFAVLMPAALGAIWLVVERARARVRRPEDFALEVDPTLIPAPQPLIPESVVANCEVG
jgi:hypothetical protein